METTQGPTPPPSGRPYEFSQGDNELIQELAQKMRFVGAFLIVAAVLLGLGGLFSLGRIPAQGVAQLIQGALYVVIGLLTYQAGASFQKIVETQGADIHHLMEALGSLRVLYRVQFVLILVAIILIAVGIVMVVVAGTAIGLR